MEEHIVPQPIPKRIRAVLSDQIIFSMRAVGDMQIHCIVLFDGMIDEDRMARAIRLGLDSEPLLGSRFSTSLWRPCWEYRHDLNNLELCKLIETTDVNQEMTKFLTSPIDPFGDPQVQACILRSKKYVFCIKVNHIAADAGGVKEFAYLLASVHRELFNNPEYIPEINLKGSRSLRQVSGKFTPLHKLGIIRRTFRNLKNNVYPNRYWTLPLVKGDHDDRTFVIRSINSERFQSIKSYCRTNTVTLNDVIIAAFYRAFTQLTDRNVKTPLRFMNTADLRRYLPAGRGEAICNLSGFVYLNIGQTVGETFNDTVSLVHHQMDFMKKDYIGLGDYPVILFSKAFPFALNRRLLDLELIRK